MLLRMDANNAVTSENPRRDRFVSDLERLGKRYHQERLDETTVARVWVEIVDGTVVDVGDARLPVGRPKGRPMDAAPPVTDDEYRAQGWTLARIVVDQ